MDEHEPHETDVASYRAGGGAADAVAATGILVICGSLRRQSTNRKLLRAAGALLPAGAELTE